MANFNIVLDTSNFKPFEYDEMIKPLLLYKQEEEARQKAYLELQDKIATLADLENSEQDIEHYNKYKAYNQELEEVADSMSKYGLTRRNNKVFQLYKKYNSEIKPSQLLLDKRNELIKEQREMSLKDPTLMFNINYADASLNDVKAHKGTYESISGDMLYKMGKEQAAAASLRNISIGRRQELANQYFAIRKGYGAEAAQRFLENQNEIPELANAVNRIKNSAGTSRLGDDSRATDYILNGIMSGLAYDENHQNDRSYASPIEIQAATDSHQAAIDRHNTSLLEQKAAQLAYESNLAEMKAIGYNVNTDNEGKVTGVSVSAPPKEGSGDTGSEGVRVKGKWVTSDGTPYPSSVKVGDKTYILNPTNGNYYDPTSIKDGKATHYTLTQVNTMSEEAKMYTNRIGGYLTSDTYQALYDKQGAIYFTSKDFTNGTKEPRGYAPSDWSGDNDSYSLEEFAKNNKEAAESMLKVARKTYGSDKLMLKDFDVFVDTDWFSDDHYMLVPHGIPEKQDEFDVKEGLNK